MVWDSREAWERFQRDRLGPALGRVLSSMGVHEPPPRPEPDELQLVDVVTP